LNTIINLDHYNTVHERTNSTISIEGDGYVCGFGRNGVNFRIGIYINDNEVFNNTFIADATFNQYTPYYKVKKGDTVTITHEPEIMYDFGLKIN
jgi:hypothetical protein